MKYLKKFETRAEYDAVADSLITPNVSMCEDSQWISFKKKEPGPGPTPPGPTPGCTATAVTINPTQTINLQPSDTYQFTATVSPEGATEDVTWQIMMNKPDGTIDQNGSFTANTSMASDWGFVTVIAKVCDGKGWKRSYRDVKITDTPQELEHVTAVTFSPSSTTLEVGDTIKYEYMMYPYAPCTTNVVYDVAGIAREYYSEAIMGSVIEGLSAGTTTMHFIAVDGDIEKTCDITVLERKTLEGLEAKFFVDISVVQYGSSVRILGPSSAYSKVEIDGVEMSPIESTMRTDMTGVHYVKYTPVDNTKIAANAFDGCQTLTEVNIPDSVTTIEQEAFAYTYKLKTVTIPSGVTSIGDGAFANRAGYNAIEKTIIVKAATPPTLGNNVFDNSNTTKIYVPAGRVNDYKSAAGWSNYESIIEAIPSE